MEVFLRDANSIPEGCLLSVRAGQTHRQVLVDTGKALIFPPEAAKSNQLHLEVLSVLGAATLDLKPQSDSNTTHTATFSGNGNDRMSCILEVARAPVKADLGDVCKLRVNGSSVTAWRHEAAKTSETQAYLDRTDLLRVVQEAMKVTMDSQPECPLLHLAELLLSKALHDNHAEKAEVADKKDTSQPADNSTDEGPDSPPRQKNLISDARLSGSDSEDVADPTNLGFSDSETFRDLASVSSACKLLPMAITRSEEIQGFPAGVEGCETPRELLPTMVANQSASGALDACLAQVCQPDPSTADGSECLDVTMYPRSSDRLLDHVSNNVASQLLEEHVAHAFRSAVPKLRFMPGDVDEDLQTISTCREEGSVLPDMNVTMHPPKGQGTNEGPMLEDCREDRPFERITSAVAVQLLQEIAGTGQYVPKLGFMTGALEDEDLQAIDTFRDDGSVLPGVAIRSLARTGAGEAVFGVDGLNSRFSQS